MPAAGPTTGSTTSPGWASGGPPRRSGPAIPGPRPASRACRGRSPRASTRPSTATCSGAATMCTSSTPAESFGWTDRRAASRTTGPAWSNCCRPGRPRPRCWSGSPTPCGTSPCRSTRSSRPRCPATSTWPRWPARPRRRPPSRRPSGPRCCCTRRSGPSIRPPRHSRPRHSRPRSSRPRSSRPRPCPRVVCLRRRGRPPARAAHPRRPTLAHPLRPHAHGRGVAQPFGVRGLRAPPLPRPRRPTEAQIMTVRGARVDLAAPADLRP